MGILSPIQYPYHLIYKRLYFISNPIPKLPQIQKPIVHGYFMSNPIPILSQIQRLYFISNPKSKLPQIQKAIVHGYFGNAARYHPSGEYRTLRDQQGLSLHPTSVLALQNPPPTYVVFSEVCQLIWRE